MNQQGDEELKAAFAEFKELLRRESEPVGASAAPEVSLEPQAQPAPAPAAYEPDGARQPFPPRVMAQEPLGAGLAGQTFKPARPERRSGPIVEDKGESARRRRLIYLSAGIVFAGLAALGFTLVKGAGPAEEPAIADLTPPAAPAAEESADQAALEAPVDGSEAAAPAQEAAAAPADVAAPAAEANADDALPLPGVAAEKPASAAGKPAEAPAAAKAGAAALSAVPAAPAVNSFNKPPAATAALQPATRAAEPPSPAAEPAPSDTRPAAKSADKPARTAKPKAKPAQTVAKPRKPAADVPPADVADRSEVRAPAPEPAPPPAAQAESGGAFGFMKRTVNSVGSTIGAIGRSVIP